MITALLMGKDEVEITTDDNCEVTVIINGHSFTTDGETIKLGNVSLFASVKKPKEKYFFNGQKEWEKEK